MTDSHKAPPEMGEGEHYTTTEQTTGGSRCPPSQPVYPLAGRGWLVRKSVSKTDLLTDLLTAEVPGSHDTHPDPRQTALRGTRVLLNRPCLTERVLLRHRRTSRHQARCVGVAERVTQHRERAIVFVLQPVLFRGHRAQLGVEEPEQPRDAQVLRVRACLQRLRIQHRDENENSQRQP